MQELRRIEYELECLPFICIFLQELGRMELEARLRVKIRVRLTIKIRIRLKLELELNLNLKLEVENTLQPEKTKGKSSFQMFFSVV